MMKVFLAQVAEDATTTLALRSTVLGLRHPE
jgi:hypothetical protein